MQLKVLKELLSSFEESLQKKPKEIPTNLFHWEALTHFQKNWDIDAPDFSSMYARSIFSEVSRKLWKQQNYFPRDRMLDFIQLAPDFVRSIFKALFDEQQALEGRTLHFIFHCDNLMEEFKVRHPTSVETNHYHADYNMIFLYLAFRYPEKYSLYHFDGFKKFLSLVKASQPLLSHDPERFFKTSLLIHKFSSEYIGINQYFESHLNKTNYYVKRTLLPVYEFYSYIAGL